MKTALVLTGGGARGAYQVGVLKRVSEIPALKNKPMPFPILTGASAGAVNATFVAATPGPFHKVTAQLVDLWTAMEIDKVFRTDIASMAKVAVAWVRNLSFGGLLGVGKVNALLNTDPLREMVASTIDFSNIRKQIESGVLDVIGISTSSYSSGWEITFMEAKKGCKAWQRANRKGVLTELTDRHVLASSAIPIFFPPVEVAGDYYGDGCLRMISPMSNAIILGAEKIFAVGIQYHAHLHHALPPTLSHSPSVAQIIGIVLNALFFDTLLTDYDHMMKVNEFLMTHPKNDKANGDRALRILQPLVVLPSEDLGLVARGFSKRIPLSLRYLLKGLGRKRDEGMDLVSYLLFDKKYHGALIDIGYADAQAKISEIEQFFGSEK